MLQSSGGPSVGTEGRVYSCSLTPNREDRARYVALVQYEVTWRPGLTMGLRPLRRVYQWVVGPDGTERFMCVRVTVMRWRDIVPAQAHVEMRDAWMAHVKEQKAALKAAKAQHPTACKCGCWAGEQVDHVPEGQVGGA